jgi:surface carbohydrate biosynthesis protein
MNFVTTSTDNEWKENLNQYYQEIMIYDAGNVKFLELMKDLEVSLSIKYR